MVATVVQVVRPPQRDSGILARLTTAERGYVRTLKKRERTMVERTLVSDAKRLHGDASGDVAPLRIRVLRSNLPDAVRAQLFEDLRACTSEKFNQWVRRALELPLGRVHTPAYAHESPETAVRMARAQMDAVVTGHQDVKLEVLKLVCQVASGARGAGGYSLGIEGPPGTGKTHFVQNALAPVLDRPLVRIQLGGAADVSYLLGQMYTYEGSKEGRLAAGLVEAGCCNPIVYFDEVDKISETERGREIASVLIHLIDPTSNTCIRDRYFHGIDLDMSGCTFVFSYNDASRVHPVLLDRIHRVRVDVQTRDERMTILRDHIVPRVTARLRASVVFAEDALACIVERGARRGGDARCRT